MLLCAADVAASNASTSREVGGNTVKELNVEKLSEVAFRQFGVFLGRPTTEKPSSSRFDLSVWLGTCDLTEVDPKETVWGYLEIRRHNEPVRILERHRKTPEAFIPLVGTSVMVVAPPSDPASPADVPDEEHVKAFLLDGTGGVFLPKGSWHWAPYAVTDTASFLIMVSSQVLDDIEEKSIEPRSLRLY